MGVLDKLFGSGKTPKGKADFSDVRSGGSSTAPQSQAAQYRTYTVVAGDSLSKIAKREYGDASKWPKIYDANRDQIKNPDLIHPGQVLNLPREA
jgi:nucleoid-associated protein YgaU